MSGLTKNTLKLLTLTKAKRVLTETTQKLENFRNCKYKP